MFVKHHVLAGSDWVCTVYCVLQQKSTTHSLSPNINQNQVYLSQIFNNPILYYSFVHNFPLSPPFPPTFLTKRSLNPPQRTVLWYIFCFPAINTVQPVCLLTSQPAGLVRNLGNYAPLIPPLSLDKPTKLHVAILSETMPPKADAIKVAVEDCLSEVRNDVTKTFNDSIEERFNKLVERIEGHLDSSFIKLKGELNTSYVKLKGDLDNSCNKLEETQLSSKNEILEDIKSVKSSLSSQLDMITTNAKEIASLNTLTDNLRAENEALKAEITELKTTSTPAAQISDKITSEVKAQISAYTIPFLLKAKIDNHNKMVVIRGIPRTFTPTASDLEIVTQFMKNDLLMSEKEIDKFYPLNVSFRNRTKNEQRTTLIATFNCKESRNLILSKARNIKNKDINVAPSIPPEYRTKNTEFKAKIMDLRMKHQEQRIQSRIEFNDQAELVCSYRIVGTPGSFKFYKLESFIPKEIQNPNTAFTSTQESPDPTKLKKIIKIISKQPYTTPNDLKLKLDQLISPLNLNSNVRSFSRVRASLDTDADKLEDTLNTLKSTLTDHDITII